MSRHRNVRSMNYSDEYDGYDDVYGHSVEDEYCISPSDEAQFMYDRTRQPQISAFFSEQDNITEEDENLEQSNDRKNSDCFIRPTLSDLEEAKLRSCLEEIRNVIGDTIPERILVETVLKCDFNVNRSLDTILSNATSSNEIISEDPKPQRVRRERDRDFINFQSDMQCLVNPSVLNQLADNINVIELRDTEQNSCQGVLFNKKSEGDIGQKVTVEHNHAASSSFIPKLCEQRSQFPRTTNRNLSLDDSCSMTSCNIPSLVPSHSVVNDCKMKKNKFNVQIDDSVQKGGIHSSVIADSSSNKLNSEGISCWKMEEQKNLPLNVDKKICGSFWQEMEVDLLNLFDQECESAPLVSQPPLLAQQLLLAGKGDQELCKSNLRPRSPLKGEKDTEDYCEALGNLTVQESGLPTVEFSQGIMELGILGSVERRGQTDGGSSHETDNSDDENSPFSPLAALANRHRKHKSAESCVSEEKKIPSISRWKHEGSGADKKCLRKILRPNISEAESFCRSKEISLPAHISSDCVPIDKSSDDEETTFSPLAVLADKFNRGKGDSSSRSDLSSSSSVVSGLEQGWSHLLADFSTACLVGDSEEGKENITKVLCKCKSESGSYCSLYPSCGSMCMNMDSRMGSKDQHGFQNIILHEDTRPFWDIPMFSSAGSKENESGSQKKSASSLSDLAFFHLTRSASWGMKSDHELENKRIQSDTGISKSVPGGFVIPFLKQEVHEHEMWNNSSIEKQEENEIEKNADSSDDEWVIDLSNAIRDPVLRLSDNVAVVERELPAEVLGVCVIEEVQEISYIDPIDPCVLDARELLKMNFSCTKKCSSFGKVLCRKWRKLTSPYVPTQKPYTGDIVHFDFSKKSPDDIIFSHQKTQ